MYNDGCVPNVINMMETCNKHETRISCHKLSLTFAISVKEDLAESIC